MGRRRLRADAGTLAVTGPRDQQTATCPVGKVSYPSEREARKALTRLVRFRAVHGDGFLEDHAYRCPACPSWHLTSKKLSGGRSRLTAANAKDGRHG